MSPYRSAALNVGLDAGPVAGVVAETTLPAKSQMTEAEALNVADGAPRPPVLQVVDRSTVPVGFPLVGSKPVANTCSRIPPHEWPRMAKAVDCGNSKGVGRGWIKSW